MFQTIFDVFSNRSSEEENVKHEIPDTTRNRVLLWCNEVLSGERQGSFGNGDYRQPFWEEIHRFLQYRLGRPQLVNGSGSIESDARSYVISSPAEEFLDFIEDIFKTKCLFHVGISYKDMVNDLNELLCVDNLPYHITYRITEEVEEDCGTAIYTRSHPKVIMKENDIVHSNVITPALLFLQQPHFRHANKEFLKALEDYRKNNFGDCLTKSGSAFESVLKVICDQNSWPYDNDRDTASTLVKTVISKTKLAPYFETTFMIVATLRNRLSSSHGSGVAEKHVSPHIAQYALNITASAIILLVEETKVQIGATT